MLFDRVDAQLTRFYLPAPPRLAEQIRGMSAHIFVARDFAKTRHSPLHYSSHRKSHSPMTRTANREESCVEHAAEPETFTFVTLMLKAANFQRDELPKAIIAAFVAF